MKIDLMKFSAVVYFLYHFNNFLSLSLLVLSGSAVLFGFILASADPTPDSNTMDSTMFLCIVGFSTHVIEEFSNMFIPSL